MRTPPAKATVIYLTCRILYSKKATRQLSFFFLNAEIVHFFGNQHLSILWLNGKAVKL